MRITIPLPADEIARVDRLCLGPATGCARDECFHEREVKFSDGKVMLLQAVASSEPETGGWTQGVLFERGDDGLMHEVGVTEPGEIFTGLYIVEHNGTEYAVNVVED